MKQAFYVGGTFIIISILVAAMFGFPPEISALLCITVPAILSGTICYIWGRHGRPRIRIDFPEAAQQVQATDPACAACGHPHQDDVCSQCDCAAFVEV